MVLYVSFFFFFQAEDGIRYRDVTGVQTCALPILDAGLVEEDRGRADPLLQAEESVQRRPSQVGVDHGDLLAGLGEGDGEVGGDRRLAVGRRRRGDHATE